MTSLNQDTHTEFGLKKRSHIRRKQHALFHSSRSFTPNPPSFLVFTSQATLAVLCASRFPRHKNTLHMDFVSATQVFGSTNDEHQKLVMPEITVLMSNSLPENDKVFVDQEEKRVFIWCSSGSQLDRESFLEFIGTPRYRNGKLPQDIPVEA